MDVALRFVQHIREVPLVDQCKHIQTDVLIYVKTLIYFLVPALDYIGF